LLASVERSLPAGVSIQRLFGVYGGAPVSGIARTFWLRLFQLGAALGNEIWFILFLPWLFWELDAAVAKQVIFTWCSSYYVCHVVKDSLMLPRPRVAAPWMFCTSTCHGVPPVGFLLVIGASLITGNRLIKAAEQQIAAQSQAQMRQLETTVDRVKTLSATELQSVVANFNQQNRTTLQSGEFMIKLAQQTDTQKAQLKIGTQRMLENQRRSMSLELLKVLLGAAAGSGIMFLLGLAGAWARSPGAGQN
jgi:hypothetical protein